jgi:hypothetical protein
VSSLTFNQGPKGGFLLIGATTAAYWDNPGPDGLHLQAPEWLEGAGNFSMATSDGTVSVSHPLYVTASG